MAPSDWLGPWVSVDTETTIGLQSVKLAIPSYGVGCINTNIQSKEVAKL